MVFVSAEGLGFAYTDRVPLLSEVRFHLSAGWYGLVGANGAGKTTLGRLIAGELSPSTGRISVEPRGALVMVCGQEVEELSPAIVRFAAQSDGSSQRQQGLLGLERGALGRWRTLSPGERKRWQLGAILAADPQVLVVDEPTNHLDAEARATMLRALTRFTGVGVVVSHDRDLLDRLTRATLRLHHGTVEVFPASYGRARQVWESAAAGARAQREALTERRSGLERRIAREANRERAAHQNRSAGRRMRNAHDHDARSLAAGRRAERGEARIGRRLTVLSGELARLAETIPDFVVDKSLGRSLFVGYDPPAKSRLLSLCGVSLAAGSRLLVNDVRVSLGRGERVHLAGPNGAGKTTLLRALLASAGPSSDRILYLPQELETDEVAALRRSVDDLPRAERGRILTLLAALGVDPERVLASGHLSPGEARKLKMAFGLATHAWGMVLDEPTNHLDLPSVERLELALRAFPGALLVVSHDAQFTERVTDTVWEIRAQQLLSRT
jgi:ATPase subunit of ABC transporter with duplicated ATPase domains